MNDTVMTENEVLAALPVKYREFWQNAVYNCPLESSDNAIIRDMGRDLARTLLENKQGTAELVSEIEAKSKVNVTTMAERIAKIAEYIGKVDGYTIANAKDIHQLKRQMEEALEGTRRTIERMDTLKLTMSKI